MAETATPMMAAMDWEPLPPRETSSRQQRRRMRTQTTPPPQPQQAKAPAPAPKRKPNRPGYNSYLKVILDDATMDRLHEVAKRIQTKVQKLEEKAGDAQSNEAPKEETTTQSEHQNDSQKDSKEIQNATMKEADSVQESKEEDNKSAEGDKQPPKKGRGGKGKKNQSARFKARSRASLHMTFFFGGEELCELPPNELQDWYNKIRGRLSEDNFMLYPPSSEGENNKQVEKEASQESQDATNAADTNEDAVKESPAGEIPKKTYVDDKFWFDVTDVRLFPPGRNNLVVAHLVAAPAWHDLHNDIRDIAKNADSQGLNDVLVYSKEKWTAHITMGNTFGGGSKAQAKKVFTEVLQEVMSELKEERDESEESSDDCLFRARTHGIGMGGPIPEQVEGLDWDFNYKPNQKEDGSES